MTQHKTVFDPYRIQEEDFSYTRSGELSWWKKFKLKHPIVIKLFKIGIVITCISITAVFVAAFVLGTTNMVIQLMPKLVWAWCFLLMPAAIAGYLDYQDKKHPVQMNRPQCSIKGCGGFCSLVDHSLWRCSFCGNKIAAQTTANSNAGRQNTEPQRRRKKEEPGVDVSRRHSIITGK